LTKSIPHILKENESRVKAMFSAYDPIKGIGSPLDRFDFFQMEAQKEPVRLPVTMKTLPEIQQVLTSKHKSAEEYEKANGLPALSLINKIHFLRLDYDFEFWAFISIKIKNKDGGNDINFLLNNGQRKLLKVLMDMFNEGRPIRVILLKARQWGGSTLTQIFMFWIQARHKTNWNSLIAAHQNQASTNIRAMLRKAVNSYIIEKFTLQPFEGMQNIKVIPERNNKITVGSMQTPESIRSDDIAMAHLSEVGLWRKTEGKKPEDLIQSILGTIDLKPMTMVVMESTAKGLGNFFHQSWTEAKRTKNYEPVFVAWFEIEKYRIEFKSEQEKIDLISSLTENEFDLWEQGATLEGIKWYRKKLGEYKGDLVIMCSEFPSNDVEAFQSSGSRFFPMRVIQKARRFVKPPLYKGDTYADAQTGPEAMNNVKIEKSSDGNLSVWSEPEIFPDIKYMNRYCVTVDIGGRSKDADDSVIKVWDRFWMMEGGLPELAACWAGKIDFDHLAWKAVQICLLYDRAFMIPEINKMREDTSAFDEGDQFYTLVDEVIGHYGNIFCRSNPEQIKKGLPKLYGFHMNMQTKPMVLNALNAAYRDDAIINYDVRSMDQADSFENKGNGKTGAVEGGNDDHVIADALGAWGCLHYMPPVEEIELKEATLRKSANNIASF
jgi:hypothetical protein